MQAPISSRRAVDVPWLNIRFFFLFLFLRVFTRLQQGVTFDSGGISIKGANNMHLMKGDMSGAAAVVAAVAGSIVLLLLFLFQLFVLFFLVAGAIFLLPLFFFVPFSFVCFFLFFRAVSAEF
jgi:hypothetical protein